LGVSPEILPLNEKTRPKDWFAEINLILKESDLTMLIALDGLDEVSHLEMNGEECKTGAFKKII
jgi:hypothetical protein